MSLLAQPPSSILSPSLSKSKLPFSWSSIPNPIPHRYRRKLRSKLRSRQSPASSVTSLSTSFSVYDTLRDLRAHRWSLWDAQYLFLIILLVFSLSLSDTPGPLVKTGFVGLIILALLLPISRQFLLPSTPIWMWLIFFFSCRFIPSEYRPGIWVRVLPALENILYGANLSNILSAHQFAVLDVLAWLPYGIIHFSAPVICSILIFVFAAPGTLPVFARSFGYMNITGVMIQVLFPCSPPWYENMYGLAPANYSMQGSPAGLARIDALFGFDMYTTNFTNSPMVFGAFPSLHAGNAILEALFMSHCFPKLRPFFIGYCMWLWWATMYLSHHYAVDLVAGSLISAVFYYTARANWLPRRQPDKFTRWDYDYVEIGDSPSPSHDYDLADVGYKHRQSSDEWTIGSSSSYSSGTMSPVGDRERDREDNMWEGETLASQPSDTEMSDVVVR